MCSATVDGWRRSRSAWRARRMLGAPCCMVGALSPVETPLPWYQIQPYSATEGQAGAWSTMLQFAWQAQELKSDTCT